MYKQRNFKNRHCSKSSYNKRIRNADGTSSFSSRSGRGYGGSRSTNRSKSFRSNTSRPFNRSNWRRRNRRGIRENIDHSLYISKDKDIKNASYVPKRNFCDFNLHSVLTKNISDRNYMNPTKIQDQAIPEVLKGKDVIGIGSTGSGKTGAFLIPMINKVLNISEEKVLIVAPTRELASQINTEFRKFAKNTNLKMVLVIGGTSIQGQICMLKKEPQFVVATPGRLIDLAKRNCIDLSSFNNVILDEVDQMLAMGFISEIKMVISKLAPKRQSLFFSATVSRKEELLANTLLNAPVKIESDKQSPLECIHRDIVKVESRDQKIQVLHKLLQKREFNKVLVFSGTKIGADKISYALKKRGIMVDSLHGDKSQHKRSKVLAKFRQNKIDVLVATDVAARGIDIPNITHVINYDEPANYNDYIHRIGRTGRIGKAGTALTFVLG